MAILPCAVHDSIAHTVAPIGHQYTSIDFPDAAATRAFGINTRYGGFRKLDEEDPTGDPSGLGGGYDYWETLRDPRD